MRVIYFPTFSGGLKRSADQVSSIEIWVTGRTSHCLYAQIFCQI